MLPFAFTSSEIAAARAISDHSGSSVQELAAILKTSESWVSQIVKNLETKGVVRTRKEGMKKSVDISMMNYALSLSDLFKIEPQVPWEKLISYSNMVALFLSATGEKSFEQGVSPVSLWRAERNLSMHGMITKGPQGTTLRNSRLKNFVNEYSNHVSRMHLLERLPKDAVVLWRSGYRGLFRIHNANGKETRKDLRNALPTALSAFPEYGIQFITPDSYYYLDPETKELTIEDIIIHTLLIEPDSQTYITYALLLIFKAMDLVDFDSLISKSCKYELEATIEGMVRYIRSHGEERNLYLPKWNELKEQADLYGIVVR